MILNVLAVDASNIPVTGLKAQDFELMDNGKTQELTSFREVDGTQSIAPPHVVLILDTVNNTGRSIAFEIKEIGKYLGSSQGHLLSPTSIATLTSSGIKASPTSMDGSVLLNESRALFKDIHPYECRNSSEDGMRSVPLSGHGGQNIGLSIQRVNDGGCLNEKFTLSLTALGDFAAAQMNVSSRVVLIWIGSGWPLLAGPEFHLDTPEIKANLFGHMVELSRILREAQVSLNAVYSPDIFRKTELQSLHVKSFAEGPPTENQAAASDFALQAIATQSGGRIVESALQMCASTMRFPSIPFLPPNRMSTIRCN